MTAETLTTLLTVGIGCIIGAAIGGGLKAFGIELPLLKTKGRQISLGVIGAVLILVSLLVHADKPPVVERKYVVSGRVSNADKPLPNIVCELDSITKRTDNHGKFFFTNLKEGEYSINVNYNNMLLRYTALCAGESTQIALDPINLANDIAAIDPSKPQAEAPPNISTNNPVLNDSITETAVAPQKRKIGTFKEVERTIMARAGQLPVPADRLSPNEILNHVDLHVYINKQDKKDNQVAFNYYLKGKPEYLKTIKKVIYQRNHKTFPEFQRYYFSSTDARSGFVFKSYQRGSISSGFVGVVLKNGQESDVFVKDIIYD